MSLKWTIERLNALVDIARLAASTLDVDTLLQRLLCRLVRVVPPADLGVIYLYDAQSEKLVPAACIGFDVVAALEHAACGASVGLLGMQERARHAGGQIEIDSAPGQGTEVRARFPRVSPHPTGREGEGSDSA